MSVHVPTRTDVSPVERELLERLPDAVFVADSAGRCLWCNTRGVELLGYPVEALRTRSLADLFAPESLRETPLRFGRPGEGSPMHVERVLRRADGEPVRVELTGTRLSDGRVIGVVRDPGERQHMLAELRHAVSLAGATLNATADGLLVHRLDGTIEAWNAEFERIWNLTPEQMRTCRTRQDVFALVRPQCEDPDEHRRRVSEIEGDPDDARLLDVRLRDGRVLERWSNSRRLEGEVVGRVVAYRDVTGQRRVLAELERMVGLHRAILEATTDGVAVTDVQGRLIAHNQQFVRMWRLPEDLVARGDLEEMTVFVQPQMQDPEGFLRAARRFRRGAGRTQYSTLEFRDGRVFERWSYPLREGGQLSGGVTVFRDITESQRQAEQLRRSQLQFLQAQKMEAVGRLAGGVAHDFNNMLTAILGHADLLARALPEGDPKHEAVEQIQLAAERSARLTRELLAFSRRQPAREQVVELVAMLERVRPLLHTLLGDRVELVVRESTTDSWVVADANWIEQALLNLAINARDAMRGEGRLTLSVGEEDVLARDLAARGAGQAGPHVVLSVNDTGPGIPPEVRPHLFEPFFTTKEPGKGTGLGLASVYGIVQQCGGFIEVRSEPGHGATRLLLPRARRCGRVRRARAPTNSRRHRVARRWCWSSRTKARCARWSRRCSVARASRWPRPSRATRRSRCSIGWARSTCCSPIS